MPKLAGKAIPLAERIDSLTKEGELYDRLEGDKVRCYACGHRCLILDGQRGICQVRFNRGGALMVPHNYVVGLQSDPIEKKPFFHVLPGSQALTFGMLGCDFHCSYCQNWITSQGLRDPVAGVNPEEISAEDMAAIAQRVGARIVTSSYNEPLITSEWAMDVFKLVKPKGLVTSYVSNGNATGEVLDYLRPWLDCYKIDLKSMSAKNYRGLGGELENVLETVRMAHRMGFWVEVVTLLVPGFNDSDEEVREAARFLAGVSPDIPWHVTAFHRDYKMTGPENTGVGSLLGAAEIGRCSKPLVRRYGYNILEYALTAEGTCPDCGTAVRGIWSVPGA
jgi:pyruvate formate lyase activating enzyme